MRSKFPHFYQATPLTTQRAHRLRKNSTPAEDLLWQFLRNRKTGGAKFRRQHSFGPFIADFYCPQYSLVIEIDGEIHLLDPDKDKERELYMRFLGVHCLRFTNFEVINALDAVIDTIEEYIMSRK